ncbi:hypothetical protein [Flammeovirga sp. SJP92]|uniref:hypothetical protein n=1 Tax=Flammeovirga sp. SJP92 TaxID=1775430 RepID=UPI000786ED75|nr:hypothetical protein [Flammeovirga sp. SJP92]KXX72529.1 hypothetical protein AVL50_00220 [Flammeovirga sp. SJP92]
MLYRILLILLCFISSDAIFAQTTLLKQKWVGSDSVYLDSNTIFQSSVRIIKTTPEHLDLKFNLGEDNFIHLFHVNGEKLKDSSIKALIEYRIYPSQLFSGFQHRSQELYQSGGYGLAKKNERYILEIEEKQKKEELFSAPNIEKTGSISRGISMGNSQDVFVNSAMNLQLQGNITDDVQLTAILTDQDLPFQPEGNTQQIQDFDRVYIELAHRNAQLSAGDIVMKNNPSVFLRYYKNVQGAQAKIMLGDDSTKVKSVTKGGISVAKGQFYSAQIAPIDGVLGPYRLRGPNGESNIVVIANSEKVYIDGKLMGRGFDADYVIDYNLAEITFTEKVLITQYTRIRIDYEYATQYYSRTITEGSHYMSGQKWDAFFNFYQEKDDRNSSLFFSLSDDEKRVLAGIGDSLQNAIVPAIDTVSEFDPNRILYTEVDTVTLGGESVLCLRRANFDDTPLYTAGFSDVGQGNGDYILDEVTSFGRYYKWVSPENGVRQGRYLPVRRLEAPNSKQMITAGGSYKVTNYETISFEGAFSNQDINLFSVMDNGNNKGSALNFGIQSQERPLGERYLLSTHASLMQIGKDFSSIDRFRSVEFDRNWALNYEDLPEGEEIYIEGGLALKDKKDRNISYIFAQREREDAISGYQHDTHLKYHIGKFNAVGDLFNMNSQLLNENQKADWLRLNGGVFYKGEILIPGYNYKLDQQSTKLMGTDSIVYSWMNFEEHEAYLKSGDSLNWNFNFNYSYREDKAPRNGKMELQTISNTYQLNVGKSGRRGNIQLGATYRKWTDYFASEPSDEESIQGRLVGGVNFGQGIGKLNGTYTISSSRELLREFVYVRVEDGRGTHTWRDLNGDGIQDQNEFFLAQNPDERQYARFYTPTDDYIPAYRSTLNLRLNLKAPNKWQKKEALKKMVSKFSNNASLLVDKKSLTDDIWGRYSPFPGSVTEEEMLAYNYAFRNTLFFNRNNPFYGADFRIISLENTQLLTQGREVRQDIRYTLGGRVNVTKLLTLKLEGYQRMINSGSDYLEDRNYNINEVGMTPSISFQPSIFMRYSLGYSIKRKLGELNPETNQESSQIQEASFEAKWNKASLFTITGRFSAIFQNYDGDPNSAIGYEMLDALNEGVNLKWNVSWTQSLFNGMQLRVQYDGRKSENSNSVHIGSMNLIALF